MWKVPNLEGNYVYTKPPFIAILHCCYSCCHIVIKNKIQKTEELLKNMVDVEEEVIKRST